MRFEFVVCVKQKNRSVGILIMKFNFFKYLIIKRAEGKGFEPLLPFGKHAFQACTFNRSVTLP